MIGSVQCTPEILWTVGVLCVVLAMQVVVLDGSCYANSSCHTRVDLHTIGMLCRVVLLLLLVLLCLCVLVVHICSTCPVLACL